MPEAQIILAQAVTYVASAPKSNASCLAVFAAAQSVRETKLQSLRICRMPIIKGSAKLGRGTGYQYAHDFPNHYVKQQYLPDEIAGAVFTSRRTWGYEKNIKEHLEYIRKNSI